MANWCSGMKTYFPLGLRIAVRYDSAQDSPRTGRELLYSSVNQFPLVQPVSLLSWTLTSWALSSGFPAHSLSIVQNPFPKEPKIQGMEGPYSLALFFRESILSGIYICLREMVALQLWSQRNASISLSVSLLSQKRNLTRVHQWPK